MKALARKYNRAVFYLTDGCDGRMPESGSILMRVNSASVTEDHPCSTPKPVWSLAENDAVAEYDAIIARLARGRFLAGYVRSSPGRHGANHSAMLETGRVYESDAEASGAAWSAATQAAASEMKRLEAGGVKP